MLFKVASECSRILNNQSCLSAYWYSLTGANVIQTLLFDYLAIEKKKKKSKQNQELLKGNIWKSSKMGDRLHICLKSLCYARLESSK